MTHRILVPLLGVLVGCGEASIARNDTAPEDGVETDTGANEPEEGRAFRVSVEPLPETADGTPLLTQPFGPFDEGDALDLVLRPSVQLNGQIRAERVTDWAAFAEVPTERFEIPGEVRLTAQSVGTSYAVSTDDRGVFTTRIVPDTYGLTVLPLDPRVPPLRTTVLLLEAEVLDLTLGPGLPLWGRVLDADADPLAGVDVYAVDADGFATDEAVTDDEGWYALRVGAGTWTVVTTGLASRRDPTLAGAPVTVEEEGARVDLTYDVPRRASLSGRVRTTNGADVVDATVRLRSLRLSSYGPDQATFGLDVPTDSRGVFDTRVPAGTYTVEVLPDAASGEAPAIFDMVDLSEDADLGTIRLEAASVLALDVVDGEGGAVGDGATLACAEQTSRPRTFVLTSDAGGRLSGLRTRTPLDCLLSPPGARDDLGSVRFTLPVDPPRTVLTLRPGTAVAGRVRAADYGLEAQAQPVDLARVRILDDQGDVRALALTQPDGSFAARVDWTGDPLAEP